MFLNETLKYINQDISPIDVKNRNFLNKNLNQISVYNHSNACSDESLCSNDTILMYSLLKYIYKGSQLYLNFDSFNYRSVPSMESKLYDIFNYNDAKDKINIVYIPSGITKALIYVNEKIESTTKENRLNNIELTLIEDTKHIIKVYSVDNTVTILTNRYSWNFLRKVLALIPVLKNIPLEEEGVKDIFSSYLALDYENWCNAFNLWFSKNNLVKNQFKKEILKIVSDNENKVKTETTRKIADLNANIRQAENSLANYYKSLNEYKQNLLALELNPYDQTVGIELADYLLNHKIIQLLKATNKGIFTLMVDAPARYYDNKYLIKYLEKNTVIEYDFSKRLLKEIYIDNKYTLLYNTQFDISVAKTYVSYNTNFNTGELNGIPHPHIMRFDCWGDNKTHIYKALASGDYIGAIEQCLAACYNLNFADTTVIKRLGRDIHYEGDYRSVKCIVDAEGNKYTPKEIYQIYKEEEKEQNNEVYSDTEN